MAKKSKAAAAVADTGVSIPQDNGEGGGEKEGTFLLGQPTWEDIGGGRWRCAETGHELPEREKDSYARSRACRLALIDHAVARKNPPLNAFKPHPEHKSKLICSITGDTINKSEEHIWKHINGKRFLNKLGKELQKMQVLNVLGKLSPTDQQLKWLIEAMNYIFVEHVKLCVFSRGLLVI